jgi:hypothetical protein
MIEKDMAHEMVDAIHSVIDKYDPSPAEVAAALFLVIGASLRVNCATKADRVKVIRQFSKHLIADVGKEQAFDA